MLASWKYSLGAGHEQDGQAANDRQDHGNDDQNHLRHLAATLLIRRVFHRLQGLDPAAFTVIALHASVEEKNKLNKQLLEGGRRPQGPRCVAKWHSHAHRLWQAVNVFAVAVDAVA